MSKRSEELQQLFAAHFSQKSGASPTTKFKLAGATPMPRVQSVGATVTDQYEVNPTDMGTLVNSGHPLFSKLSIDDVNQGQIADCYFLAFIAGLANTPDGQNFLRSIVYYDPKDPTHIIVQYARNGLITRVHCDVLITLGANGFDGADPDIWVEILEKTYADFRTVNDAYHSLDYGWSVAVADDLGCVPTNDVYLWNQSGQPMIDYIQGQLNAGFAVCLLTPAYPQAGWVIGSHAYTAIGKDASGNMVLRNPWGNHGNPIYVTVAPADMTYSNFTDAESGLVPTPTFSQADVDAAYARGVVDEKAKVSQLLSPVNAGLK